ncbi:hypothetical protein QQX98_005888 [Neonectria punicea]|uniref:Uncharacterized protein n=1 Tax=Neonectria punicea TaxID=979145 RepID=A0ABR1H2Y4_9HYPO
METQNAGEFSKLEAGFAALKVERRRVSTEALEPWRHANESDLIANDLDFNYNVDTDSLPTNLYPSMQGILPALQYSSHMGNLDNFVDQTTIECFDQTDDHVAFHTLDTAGLDRVLDTLEQEEPDVSVCDTSSISTKSTPTAETNSAIIQPPNTPSTSTKGRSSTISSGSSTAETAGFSTNPILPTPKASSAPEIKTSGRLLVFFVPLIPKKESSFGTQVAMQRSSVQRLFETLGVNPEFLLNMLGRPDYWSPRTRWQCNMDDELTVCDYFCQQPRWNLQLQGAPLSVYVIRHIKTKLTAYIISHKTGDSSVHALQQVLKVGVNSFGMGSRSSAYLTNPFEIAVLLSSLSFEASKYHVARFRRYMWMQVNKVDDHLAGLETSDRGRLTELTKSLQIISQQADSHLLNANVAIITAMGVRDTQAKLHDFLGTPKLFRHPAEDAINYVIDSMEKQKMLFLNYKSRKDGTMSLVYNLVTQRDASNNIELAQSMKRDSTSMSGIAALTMVFLPGTFTSSLQAAGFPAKGITLLSVGHADISVADDETFIRSNIEPYIQAGKDVILIVHSYAGFPATAAISGLDSKGRRARGESGGVLGITYLASFVPLEGESVFSLLGNSLLWWMKDNVSSGLYASCPRRRTNRLTKPAEARGPSH